MKSLISFLMTAVTLSAAASAWQYPPAEKGPTVDDYFGTKVADPYRWMEDLDSAPTQAWVAAENTLTQSFLEKIPQRASITARLTELWNYPRVGLPFKEGGRYFYSKNDGLQNQAVIYTQDTLASAPRLLIDPNTLAKDGTVALSDLAVSKDGRWAAYGTAAAGSDWNEFRVRSVADGKDTEDYLKWIKFSGVAWTKDNAGFYYSRYPEQKMEPGKEKTFGELANQKLYYHRLGTPQEKDVLIHELPAEPKWFVGGDTTEDGRYLIITVQRGSSPENLLKYSDLVDPQHPKTDAPVVSVIENWEAQYQVVGNDGPVFYVLTDGEAPHKRLIAIDTRTPDKAHWRTVIPESKDVIESVSVIGGKFVVRTMHDASSRLLVYAKDGTPQGEISLPGIGTVAGISGREDEPELFYNFTSYTYPTSNFRYDLSTGKGELFQAPKVLFDPSAYETKQVFYPSKDGAKIPMFITYKKGLKLDGHSALMLYGYGGFEVSLTPSFSVSTVAWLELGGIYAVPNLRGGGEYGKEWHEAGTKERKQNVFDDFIGAADYLVANHYTSHDRMVVSGGSNGGLLIGATVNQRPDLCRVAFPAVGVMDMLRFHKFTIGYAWVSDYGSSDDAAGFNYLHAYSPVHTVKVGAKYPAVLVTTADHDDRVYPAHSFKYTATLQAATQGVDDSGPVLIRIETRAGHGAGKPTTKVIAETADKLAFAAHFLDLHLAGEAQNK